MALSLATGPHGPLGGFWRPSPEIPTPSAIQFPLLALLAICEAFAFGFGVSFLVWGGRMVMRLQNVPSFLARAAHLSVCWILINWWPHDSLHAHIGHELAPLIAIEYGFHVTLIIAGAIIVAFMLRLSRTAPQRN